MRETSKKHNHHMDCLPHDAGTHELTMKVQCQTMTRTTTPPYRYMPKASPQSAPRSVGKMRPEKIAIGTRETFSGMD